MPCFASLLILPDITHLPLNTAQAASRNTDVGRTACTSRTILAGWASQIVDQRANLPSRGQVMATKFSSKSVMRTQKHKTPDTVTDTNLCALSASRHMTRHKWRTYRNAGSMGSMTTRTAFSPSTRLALSGKISQRRQAANAQNTLKVCWYHVDRGATSHRRTPAVNGSSRPGLLWLSKRGAHYSSLTPIEPTRVQECQADINILGASKKAYRYYGLRNHQA